MFAGQVDVFDSNSSQINFDLNFNSEPDCGYRAAHGFKTKQSEFIGINSIFDGGNSNSNLVS